MFIIVYKNDNNRRVNMMTRILKWLESAGYINRKVVEHDKRGFYLELSDIRRYTMCASFMYKGNDVIIAMSFDNYCTK